MKLLLKKYYPAVIILSLFLILLITNYIPGTYLSGWDNLQTDLNPLLGLKRNFFSAWQEYQSFGLAAGMGHAADLLRTVILYLASFVIPQSFIRYLFQMSMIPLGAWGMYLLLKQSGFDNEKRHFALLGSIFYIFNFAVIQMMFLPFEAFSVFFGMLPMQLYIFLRVMNKPPHLSVFYDRKLWLYFILVNIAGTPAFIAQQLFVVYFMLLGLLGLGLLYSHRTKAFLFRGILACVLILLVNAFWLLPQYYFVSHNGTDIVKDAKINQIATEDVLFVNKNKGNLKDFLSFNGFFYDSIGSNHEQLFAKWKDHRETIPIQILIFTLSAVMLLGVLRPSRYRLPFTLCLILIMIGLLSNTPGISQLNDLIRSNSFINQIFRSPFTKFSISYALVASYFFAVGSYSLLEWSKKKIKRSHVEMIGSLLLGLIILIINIPTLQGYYISPEMKVEIPKEYFQTMDYFNSIDHNKRIALLPDYTFWGWFHHNWGYDGSGFLWYGIEQPIISRTFDVWDIKSESYFWEIKRAIEAEDLSAFEKAMRKYDINYLIFDKTLEPIISNDKGLQYDGITRMLSKSQYIHLAKDFGTIQIYEVTLPKPFHNFVWSAQTLPNIGPEISLTNEDSAYSTYGDYMTTTTRPFDAYFPFLDLTTQTNIPNKLWSVQPRNENWDLTTTLPQGVTSYTLLSKSSEDINLYNANGSVKFILPINSSVNGQTFSLSFPQNPIADFNVRDVTVTPCESSAPDGLNLKTDSADGITLESKYGGQGCFSYSAPNLDQRYGYITTIKSSHETGRQLYFYILDKTKDQAYIEDSLTTSPSYYIIGSKSTEGIGYDFTFQNNSHTTIPTINSLNTVRVDLMPYAEIKNTRFVKTAAVPQAAYTAVTATKYSYYTYTLHSSPENKVIILSQAYRPGWNAYLIDSPSTTWLQRALPFFFGEKLTTHIPVNNWENGWIIPNPKDQSIILKYTPQYLQYFGLLLLLASLSSSVFVLLRLRRG